jgi:hypothetical protein
VRRERTDLRGRRLAHTNLPHGWLDGLPATIALNGPPLTR